MSIKLPSYPKIYNLGAKNIGPLFDGDVEITEKVDGSQFRFGITAGREVVCGSKNQDLLSDFQNDMFADGYNQVQRIKHLLESLYDVDEETRTYGLYFYGEYLQKPKHNTLVQDRIPKNNVVVFGCKCGDFIEEREDLDKWAEVFDFDVVPLLYKGEWPTGIEGLEKFKKIQSETTSYLGGTLIEGVVIKNYNQQTLMMPFSPCFGKYVSEKFKERNDKNWKENSGKGGLQNFFQTFRTEARWVKAIQHLRDEGKLTDSPKDIGALLKEIHNDIGVEEQENIKSALYKMYVKDIKRVACAGFPEFYKDKLAEKQFNG